jgi:hypothetical protein
VRFGEFLFQALERPANCGLFTKLEISEQPIVELLAPIFPKVSTDHKGNSRFLETLRGDRRRKPLRGGAGSLTEAPTSDQGLCGMRRGGSITAIAMNENQRDRAFR